MKNLFIVIILFSEFTFSQTTFPTLQDLNGLVDNQNHDHLFFKINSVEKQNDNYYLHNDVYHLDLNNNKDTVFLQAGGIIDNFSGYPVTNILGFQFWDKDPSKYIAWGIVCSLECGTLIKKFDKEYDYNEFNTLGILQSLKISKQNDSLLYGDFNPVVKSTDGGKHFTFLDSFSDYKFLDLNPFNDKILYLTKKSSSSTFQSDSLFIMNDGNKNFSFMIESGHAELLNIYFDADSTHLYILSRETDGYHLYISDNNGNNGSWKDLNLNSFVNHCFFNVYNPSTMPIISVSENESGVIYLVVENRIFYSTDYAQNFSLYKEFDKSLTGFFKPENSSKYFAEDSHHLYEVINDSVNILKSFPADTSFLRLYPLQIGNKWIYDVTTMTYPSGYSIKKESQEITGDTTMPNNKKYFILKTENGYQYLRADTSTAKVYDYYISSNKEAVLFDLSANAGELFKSDIGANYNGLENFYVVKTENYESYQNSQPKKKTFGNCSQNSWIFTLVENLGIDSIMCSNDDNYTIYKKLIGSVIDGKSFGDTTYTSVQDKNQMDINYSLLQNYPNPFNPNSTIEYHLAKAGNVSLKIYDILGREIIALINNEYEEIGNHKISFNGSSLASGVYYYKLNSGDFSQTKKMILMK